MAIPFSQEIDTLFSLAKARGLGEVEVYAQRHAGLTLRANDGKLESFQRSDSVGLGVRVLLGERVGYAYTENLGAPALERALGEAAANAALVEAEPGAGLAPERPVPAGPSLYNPAIEAVPLGEKIALVTQMEAAAYAADARVKAVPGCVYSEGHSFVRVANSRGLDRHYRSNTTSAVVYPIASEHGENKTATELVVGREFGRLNAEQIARVAVQRAVGRLGAKEPLSGNYPVVFTSRAMVDLLAAFSEVFSAKAAQEGKSLLAGKEGLAVASPLLTLNDDALLADGLASRPFDDEGVPSAALSLISAGTFKTFLHNAQTARHGGRESTGHAARGSYKGTLGVAPSNLFVENGTTPAARLAEGQGTVILIDDLQGLHAGTNPISGDFSLQAQGYLYEDGEYRHPVHNFTVAGSFLPMLAAVEAIGDDLAFYPHGAYIGSPSVRIKELSIAGQ